MLGKRWALERPKFAFFPDLLNVRFPAGLQRPQMARRRHQRE